jgi:hypothetical protein
VRRNNRFVLPIQARPRIDAKYRAAFDYSLAVRVCRAIRSPRPSRSDCVF